MSLFDEAREAYDRRNLEGCWKLMPRLVDMMEVFEQCHKTIKRCLTVESEQLRAEVERLERENAALRLRHNDPRDATIEVQENEL